MISTRLDHIRLSLDAAWTIDERGSLSAWLSASSEYRAKREIFIMQMLNFTN